MREKEREGREREREKRERVRNGLNWNIGDDGWEMELTRRWEGKHILFKEEDEKNERGRLKTKMTRVYRGRKADKQHARKLRGVRQRLISDVLNEA